MFSNFVEVLQGVHFFIHVFNCFGDRFYNRKKPTSRVLSGNVGFYYVDSLDSCFVLFEFINKLQILIKMLILVVVLWTWDL